MIRLVLLISIGRFLVFRIKLVYNILDLTIDIEDPKVQALDAKVYVDQNQEKDDNYSDYMLSYQLMLIELNVICLIRVLMLLQEDGIVDQEPSVGQCEKRKWMKNTLESYLALLFPLFYMVSEIFFPFLE